MDMLDTEDSLGCKSYREQQNGPGRHIQPPLKGPPLAQQHKEQETIIRTLERSPDGRGKARFLVISIQDKPAGRKLQWVGHFVPA